MTVTEKYGIALKIFCKEQQTTYQENKRKVTESNKDEQTETEQKIKTKKYSVLNTKFWCL